MPKQMSRKKDPEQKKLKQIRHELLKLDKKLQRIETNISVLSEDSLPVEQINKENNTDV
jgi:archaellum component FlaC